MWAAQPKIIRDDPYEMQRCFIFVVNRDDCSTAEEYCFKLVISYSCGSWKLDI